MKRVDFNGWKDCVRLTNGNVELIVTQTVGPRVVRFGFLGGPNLFAELAGQGGSGEDEWMIRGGHRFWIAPEEKPKTYELDNEPIEVAEIDGGVRTVQQPGPLTGVRKTMEIRLGQDRNDVQIDHRLENCSGNAIELAPWALSVMAPDGMAIIPLPDRIPHTDRLTHNQQWSLWGYTDFADPRWTLGSRYVLFRQDRERGPNKLGIAHREGWVGYLLGKNLFVKRFDWIDGATYPDGGVNFETFSNEEFLEVETLGSLTSLAPGAVVTHTEKWELFDNVPPCKSEDDIDAHVLPLLG